MTFFSWKKTADLPIAALLLLFLFINGCSENTETKESTAAKKDLTAAAAAADNVATVNDSGISRHDFDRAMASADRQFANIGAQEGGKIDIRQEVLNRLIDFELMVQDSRQRGITIDESAVAEELNAVQAQFTDEKGFTAFLQENNFSEQELSAMIEKRQAIQGLQKQLSEEFQAGITISEEDCKTFYEQNGPLFEQPEQVKARHILIKVDEGADAVAKKAALQKITAIEEQLKKGAEFAELARSSSECPSSSNGGDLGFFTRDKMVKPFSDAAFSLQAGAVSPIVETEFGYHLIKVEEKKTALPSPYEEVKTDIMAYLSQTRLEQAQASYLQGLREKANITVLPEKK